VDFHLSFLPTGTGAQKENFDVQPGNCDLFDILTFLVELAGKI